MLGNKRGYEEDGCCSQGDKSSPSVLKEKLPLHGARTSPSSCVAASLVELSHCKACTNSRDRFRV